MQQGFDFRDLYLIYGVKWWAIHYSIRSPHNNTASNVSCLCKQLSRFKDFAKLLQPTSICFSTVDWSEPDHSISRPLQPAVNDPHSQQICHAEFSFQARFYRTLMQLFTLQKLSTCFSSKKNGKQERRQEWGTKKVHLAALHVSECVQPLFKPMSADSNIQKVILIHVMRMFSCFSITSFLVSKNK